MTQPEAPAPLGITRYADLVAHVGEVNRPSGGLATVNELLAACMLPRGGRMLEIGSTTGFTSLAAAEIAQAEVVGIDVNAAAVQTATAEAAARGIRVSFQVADARDLPFPDGHFDAVWLSNVPSFMTEPETAIAECVRVTRRRGALALVPIAYRSDPPKAVREAVEQLVGAPIGRRSVEDWVALVQVAAQTRGRVAEVVHRTDHVYTDVRARLDRWCDERCASLDVTLPPNLAATVATRYRHAMETFNDNLQHCMYARVLLRVDDADLHEEELFLTSPM